MSEPAKDTGGQNPTATAAAGQSPRAGKPGGGRKWLFRLAAGTLIPALVFGLLELGLRLADYGYPTDFFLDGSQLERRGTLIDNPEFGRWVFPSDLDRTPRSVSFAIPARKPAGTYRVFVVGESAAMGFPDPSSSFPRVLEVMLRMRYPGKDFEVVNASVVAINSHVVLPIARQCLRQSADLLVVHLGNNEVVGPFGAAGVLGPYSPHRSLIRANLWIKTTKTGQLLGGRLRALRSNAAGPRRWDGMGMFVNSPVAADDERLPRIYDHFRANLEDICAAAADAGVPVLVCTVPVNLRDSAPFGSAHAAGLGPEAITAWDETYQDGVRREAAGDFAGAARCYEEAARTDDRFADLAFRLGRCDAALGETGEARRQFARARDLDTLRFRADTTVNETIRRVVGTARGARLADAERAFEEGSPSGIPGEEFFLEHVHMNFHGNYTVARTVFQTLAELAPPSLGPPAGEAGSVPTEAECAERLAWTGWNELKVATQVNERLLREPPFTGQLDVAERDRRWKARIDDLRVHLLAEGLEKTRAVYRRAVLAAKEDWMIRLNYGQFLTEAGEPDAAAQQYLAALTYFNHCLPAHCKLGQLLFAAGQVEEAKAEYEKALHIAPDCSEALYGLADVLAAEGKVAEGLAICEGRLNQEPDRAAALVALGAYLARNGRPEEARSRFTQVLELDPENLAAHVQLGDAELKVGNMDAAIAHFETALKTRPDWPELREHLAEVRKNRGRADEGAP